MSETTSLPNRAKKGVGLSGVTAGNTALCTVGRSGNDLHYRGYDILDVADTCEFEEIAFLLVHGTLPTRAELIARYEERSGRSMSDIRWYQLLALWKAIVFMEGNYKRAASGMSDDPYLKAFGDTILQMAERAEAVTRGG